MYLTAIRSSVCSSNGNMNDKDVGQHMSNNHGMIDGFIANCKYDDRSNSVNKKYINE